MNVFLLTAIRSGSTYLIPDSSKAQDSFTTQSHSDHPSLSVQRKVREFLAPNIHANPWTPETKTRQKCVDHLRHKASFIKDQPCLFKILMEQYQHYMLTGEDRPLVEEIFPGLKYLWLERSDIIARTVSAYIFFNSKVDHCWDQKTYDEYMSKAVALDEKGLLDVYHNHVKRCDWGRFLQGTNYLKVDYEALVSEPLKTLTCCLDHLGLDYGHLDLEKIVDHQPRFKTARPETEVWAERLRILLRKRSL